VKSINACSLPADALLAKYAHAGSYTDCFSTEVLGQVSQAEYVEAFYTGGIFKIERHLLRWFLSKPSTDSEATQLATGGLNTFSAWRVEGRTANQLLMRDLAGRTRSWLMVAPLSPASQSRTRLYFGSAVVPVTHESGQASMGFIFKALLGFHKLYSRVLLNSATSRLARSRRTA
jgi:hypothetical protein